MHVSSSDSNVVAKHVISCIINPKYTQNFPMYLFHAFETYERKFSRSLNHFDLCWQCTKCVKFRLALAVSLEFRAADATVDLHTPSFIYKPYYKSHLNVNKGYAQEQQFRVLCHAQAEIYEKI
jgi:hypothetical protein